MIVENKILPASNKMIEFACKNFHYSKSVPCGRKMAFAIFEESHFTGVIIYSTGSNNNIAKPFNMKQGQVIELTRVALKTHKNPVSYYLSKTIYIIIKESPKVQIIVSYADKDNQGHLGKIYQANNWIYLGISKTSDKQYFYNNKWTHERTINAYTKAKREYLKRTLPSRENSDKYKYIYCMNKKLRREYVKYKKEYPRALDT